jgi:hypothetical protein
VDRAALPDEAGAEFLEDAIDLHQCAPEARGEFAIVVMVLSILLEWDPIRHFTRCRMDPDVETKRRERVENLVIEVRHGTRLEGYRSLSSIGRLDQELITEQIEVDLEGSTVVGNQRSAKATRGHIERNVPGMVGPRRLDEPDLSDYLGPHVERRRRIGPVLERKIRPIDALGSIRGVRHGFLAFASYASAAFYVGPAVNPRGRRG